MLPTLVPCALLLLAAPIEFLPSKYDGHPRCEEIRASVAALRAAAVATLSERVGLAVEDRPEIVLRFQDLSADPEAARGGHLAIRRTETREGREVVTITLFWEYLVTGQADAGEEIAHEYVHAFHRLHLDRAAYARVPRWVREGLALWVARQGPARLRWLLQDHIESLPTALVDGLEGDAHDFDDYAEDWLAFQYVEDEHGTERLKAVARDLLTGARAWPDAIRTHTGEDAAAFLDNARRYSRSAVRLEENGLRDELLPLLRWHESGRHEEAATGLSAFLERRPQAWCAPLARLTLARCHLALGRLPEARAGLREILARHAADLGKLRAVKDDLVRCERAAGDEKEAKREEAERERDFPVVGK